VPAILAPALHAPALPQRRTSIRKRLPAARLSPSLPAQHPKKVKGIMTASESAVGTRTAHLAEMHSRFLQFLRGRIGDPATAEDILQAAYLKAMQHESELRQEESSVAWFYRILRNSITDHYRQTATRSRAIDQFTAEWTEGYEMELQNQACTCIREVLPDLKPEYRSAIEQVDLRGESVESFAASHNTTANNAYVRVHRARKAVARKLTEVCGTCATHKCVDCSCKAHK